MVKTLAYGIVFRQIGRKRRRSLSNRSVPDQVFKAPWKHNLGQKMVMQNCSWWPWWITGSRGRTRRRCWTKWRNNRGVDSNWARCCFHCWHRNRQKSSISSGRRPWWFSHCRKAAIAHSKYGNLAPKKVELALTSWSNLNLESKCEEDTEVVPQQHGTESISDVVQRCSKLRWMWKKSWKVRRAASQTRWVGKQK